jgi:hypothetical protein
MKAILLGLLFVATIAHAQSGVALFTPAASLSAADQARADLMMKARPNIVSITPVTVNRNALDSNIITVQIAGREFRYGVRERYKKEGQSEEWYGSIVGGDPNEGTNNASLFRSESGAISGFFHVWIPVAGPPDYFVHRLVPGEGLAPSMFIRESLRAQVAPVITGPANAAASASMRSAASAAAR